MATCIQDKSWVALASWKCFLSNKNKQATSGTSAASYELMEPHYFSTSLIRSLSCSKIKHASLFLSMNPCITIFVTKKPKIDASTIWAGLAGTINDVREWDNATWQLGWLKIIELTDERKIKAGTGTRLGSKPRAWRKAHRKISQIPDTTRAQILAEPVSFLTSWTRLDRKKGLLGLRKAGRISRAR